MAVQIRCHANEKGVKRPRNNHRKLITIIYCIWVHFFWHFRTERQLFVTSCLHTWATKPFLKWGLPFKETIVYEEQRDDPFGDTRQNWKSQIGLHRKCIHCPFTLNPCSNYQTGNVIFYLFQRKTLLAPEAEVVSMA